MKAVGLALAIIFGITTGARAQTGPLLPEPLEIKLVPPPWPNEVTEPYDDIQLPGSICLKPDLQKALLDKVLWSDKFPEIANKIATAQAKRDTDVANGWIASREAFHKAELDLVKKERPTWPKVVLFIGVALVVGGAAGYVGGKVLP